MCNSAPERQLFISGPSRSGTAMLRSAMNQSPAIALTGETHYFDDLRTKFLGKARQELSQTEVEACCDYFRVQLVRPYGKGGDPNESWMSREALLDETGRVAQDSGFETWTDNMLVAFCRLVARREGAVIWGEKTPRHVFRIDEILTLFPEAKVICMVRDPRAVVASYRDWQYRGGLPVEGDENYMASVSAEEERTRKSYHIVIATMMWRAAVGAARRAQSVHGPDRVRIVKYEDVIAQPRQQMQAICDWVGIAFSDSLLEIPLHNSSSSDYTAKAGVSTAPQNRWKTVLSQAEVAVIERIASQAIRDQGYERVTDGSGLVSLACAYATLPLAVLRAARANKDRYGSSLLIYILRRLRAAMGS